MAKALAQTPQLLLLDEFTSHLDLNYKYEMLNLLKKALKEEGLTIISVFHDLNLASIASHRLLLLNEGKTGQGKNGRVNKRTGHERRQCWDQG